MYTVVLLAAMTSGHAMTGQARAGNPCRGCFGCYGGYSGSGYNYMVANGYQSAFSVYAPVVNAVAVVPGNTKSTACTKRNACAVSGASKEKVPAVQSDTPAKTKAPKPEGDASPKTLGALDAEAKASYSPRSSTPVPFYRFPAGERRAGQ
jgi:hypothetical protein